MILFVYACALIIGPLYFPSERGVQRIQVGNGSLAACLRMHPLCLFLSLTRLVPFHAFFSFFFFWYFSPIPFLLAPFLQPLLPSHTSSRTHLLYIYFRILTSTTIPPLHLFFTLRLISHYCILSFSHLTLPSSLDSVTASQDGLKFLEQAEKDYYDHTQGPAQ